MQLGVAAALVDGVIVDGDVEVGDTGATEGRVVATGLPTTAGGGLAVPGLVDLQVNGFAGVEFRSCDAADYGVAASALAARGVTAIQPTFFSQSIDAYEQSLRVLSNVLRDPPPGTVMLPAHLEGPFMSETWKGAHQSRYLIDPDPAVARRLLDAGPVGFVTLAPELPGGTDLIAMLTAAGVRVSVGHSDATAQQTRDAAAAGAVHLTHCWNAHRRLTSRDPGPGGAALSGDDLVVGLIADLVHVSAEVVRLTMRSAPGRVAVTTDAISLAGTFPDDRRPESSEQGDHRVGIVDGAARRADGTIAGGIAGPDDCLRNLVAIGIPLADAVDACGGVQRRLLGLPEIRLRAGDPADIAVLDDQLRVLRTYVGGSAVHGPRGT